MSRVATLSLPSPLKRRAFGEDRPTPAITRDLTSSGSSSPNERKQGSNLRLFYSQLPHSNFSKLLPTRGLTEGKDELCMHFIKHGTCKHQDTCRFLHDSGKVQVCRNFVRGLCSKDDCRLSHDLDQDRLPECGEFLKGCCLDENCFLVHVKKSNSAEECDHFNNYFCSAGRKCPKRHFYTVNRPSRGSLKRKNPEPAADEEETDLDELLDRAWEQGKHLKVFYM
jgi:Zinc finger C-x8-C-x5-C-x3-H type (and similar)